MFVVQCLFLWVALLCLWGLRLRENNKGVTNFFITPLLYYMENFFLKLIYD